MSRPPIDGATVLLTGASSGIGLELAKLFAARAKVLVLVARRKDRLVALNAELEGAHPSLVVRVEPNSVPVPAGILAVPIPSRCAWRPRTAWMPATSSACRWR